MTALRRLRIFWIPWVTMMVLGCFSNAVAQTSYKVTDLGREEGVLSAKLRSTEPGRRGSEAVALRHPVMPVANSLGSGLVGINGNQL